MRLADGGIRNAFTVKLRNMEARPRDVEVAIAGVPGAVLWRESGSRAAAGTTLRLRLAPDRVDESRLFVAAPAAGEEHAPLIFSVAPRRRGGTAAATSRFERPEDER